MNATVHFCCFVFGTNTAVDMTNTNSKYVSKIQSRALGSNPWKFWLGPTLHCTYTVVPGYGNRNIWEIAQVLYAQIYCVWSSSVRILTANPTNNHARASPSSQ